MKLIIKEDSKPYKKLRDIAKKRKCTVAIIIREAVLLYLDQYERQN